MPNAFNPNYAKDDGYTMGNGRRARVAPITLLGSQTLAAGITVGPTFESGEFDNVRLHVAVSAKSGTSPTLDVTIQTSRNGRTGWRSVSTFTQRTDAATPPDGASPAGLVMGAVAAAGTTPPTVTLSGTQLAPVNFRMECTTLGARGTAVVRYSVDGGVTYVSNVTTAATISVIDPDGFDTGLTINYANATAAVDNVWTASTVGYERKAFTGLDRFVRAVCLIGGSATPTMTAEIVGELS
jgi:hypothetical protein